MVVGKVHLTKNYARYRQINPSKFIAGSFRTQELGLRGHTKRIAGRLKKTGKWATQSILLKRNDYDHGLRLSKNRRLIQHTVYYLNRNKR
jgi:hypothetical protein